MHADVADIQAEGASRWTVHLGRVQLFASVLLVAGLAWFELSSVDIGYHVAYGERFLATHHIVDVDPFIYGASDHHFINANWLSQVVMAWVFQRFDWVGLFALRVGLIAIVFVCLAGLMHARGAGAGLVGWGMLAAGVGAYERFSMRPELFSYAVMMGVLWLLSGGPGRGARIGVPLLQLLWVNLHSYFLVGPLMGGAMACGDVLGRMRSRVHVDDGPSTRKLAGNWFALLALQMAACLVNPWHVHGAVFPIRTINYLKTAQAMAQNPGDPVKSPWGLVSEFQSPFGFIGHPGASRTTHAYLALLALAGAAVVGAALRGKFGFGLVILAMALMSMQMRRNVAQFALVASPLAMLALNNRRPPRATALVKSRAQNSVPARRGQPRQMFHQLGAATEALALVVTLASTGWWLAGLWTGQFYLTERRPGRRLAAGWSDYIFPFAAVDWINQHPDLRPRFFTDLMLSSNVLPWIRNDFQVYVDTNTFAYPPDRLLRAWDVGTGKQDYRALFDEYGVNVVLLRAQDPTQHLIHALAVDRGWSLVWFDPHVVLFVRRIPAHAALIAAEEKSPDHLDVRRWMATAPQSHVVTAFRLIEMAAVPFALGWYDHARPLLEEAVRNEPGMFEAFTDLGICHKASAEKAGSAGHMEDAEKEFQSARRYLQGAADLMPHLPAVWYNLGLCQGALGAAAGMRGDVAEARKWYLDARSSFEKLATLMPNDPAARHNLELTARAIESIQNR